MSMNMTMSTSTNDYIPEHIHDDIAYPSVCIPRVFPNISWKRVKSVFENDFQIGIVDRVDMINKENDKGEKFKRVFVHFKKWNDNKEAQDMRKCMISGETTQIAYDGQWYWKVSMSRIPKPTFEKTEPRAKTSRIVGGAAHQSRERKEISELKTMLLEQSALMANLQKMITSGKAIGHGNGFENQSTERFSPPFQIHSPQSVVSTESFGPTTPVSEAEVVEVTQTDTVSKPFTILKKRKPLKVSSKST